MNGEKIPVRKVLYLSAMRLAISLMAKVYGEFPFSVAGSLYIMELYSASRARKCSLIDLIMDGSKECKYGWSSHMSLLRPHI